MAVVEQIKGVITRLFDAWGRPVARPAAADLGVRTPGRVRDRQSLGSILSGVTPQRLASIFSEADTGMIGRQIELAEDLVERDYQLASVLETARADVLGVDWSVQPGNESEGSMRAADWCREWLDEECLQQVLERLCEALLSQWAVERVNWATRENRGGNAYWYPESFEPVDGRRLAWPQVDGPDVHAPGLMIDWNPQSLEPVTPGQYITHAHRVNRTRPGKRALVRTVATLWMVKRFALIDFASLVEKWGIPFLVFQYAQGSSETEIDAILDRLIAAGGNRIAAVPAGSAVQTESASAQISSLPQRELIRLCDEGISKAIIGSTTISDAAASNDAVSSPTHGDVRRLLRNARAKSLAYSVRRDLLAPWFEWNRTHFGDEAAAPKLLPTLVDRESPKTRGEVYLQAKQLGMQVKSDQLYGDLGIEKPAGVEDVVELKPEPAPFGAGMGFGRPPMDGRERPDPDGEDEEEPKLKTEN